MKNYSILAAALSFAVIISCQKEISENQQIIITPDNKLDSITLYTGNSRSKTSVSGMDIVWSADDKIDIFSNADDYSTAYPLSASEVNGNAAKFTGEVAKGTTDFYAVYPSGFATSVSAGQIGITVPTNQTPKADSFGEEMNVSVAKGTKTIGNPQVNGVAFHNVCSYLKFTVPSYIPNLNKVEVTCDRAIAGSTTINYAALESGTGTIIESGSEKTITMEGSFAAGSTFWFVLTPGDVNSLTINMTTADGDQWTRRSTKAFTLNIGTPKNLGTIDFVPALESASAIHTKSGETLTGTEVNVNLGFLPSQMSSISAVNLSITNSSGIIVRTYASGTPITNSATIPADSSWPYLPQDNYTISGTYTINGTTKNFAQTSFTSPAPTFTVNTPLAHTSYDTYYNNGNLNNANAANREDGSTIYGISNNGVTISSEILTKYASLASGYSYTIDGKAASEGNNANQTWAAHDVVALFTFDGVEMASAALTCYVTGVPYRCSNFIEESGNWTASDSAIKFNDLGIHFYSSAGNPKVTYKQNFIFPNYTQISVSAQFYIEAKWLTEDYTLRFFFGRNIIPYNDDGAPPRTLSLNCEVNENITMSGTYDYSLPNNSIDAYIGNISVLYR